MGCLGFYYFWGFFFGCGFQHSFLPVYPGVQKIRTEIKEGSLCSVGRVGIRGLSSKNMSKTCVYHVVQLKVQYLSC